MGIGQAQIEGTIFFIGLERVNHACNLKRYRLILLGTRLFGSVDK
jgi:hypothetical protein